MDGASDRQRRLLMKQMALTLTLLLATVSMTPLNMPIASAQDLSNGAANFYKSDRVAVEKVTFKNKLGMKVAAICLRRKRLIAQRARRRLSSAIRWAL